MLSLFPRGVLDEILNLIESVSEGFPSYFSRKMKTSELQSMSIRKEHKNKTLASFTDYLNPGIVSMDELEAQRQWYLYEETAPHCSNAEVCLKSDARKQL